jgi:UPF0755 protein
VSAPRVLQLGLGLALACAAAGLWSASRLFVAAGSEDTPTVFEVLPGESLGTVATRLDAHGLLPRAPLFGPTVLVGFARLTSRDRRVKSGEYDVHAGMTPVEILDRMVAGEVKTYAVAFPEGLRLDEIAARLEAAGVVAAGAFLARARDADFARAQGVEADSLEGYLYPETYRFPRSAAPDDVLRPMLQQFELRLSDDDRAALARSRLSLHQVVTLASIVEKETSQPAERPLVAAVMHNRLARGMRLQSDPTVIYGVLQVSGAFDGNLRKRDLLADTPWNTYTRAGLPRGPIANPSIDSIRAVLAPADVPYLYFVARNDGTHVFSRTLEEHARAVDKWQRGS